MALDLVDVERQLRYIVNDRLTPGTPVADIALIFATTLSGIHYEFQAAIRRVQQLEGQLHVLQSEVRALQPEEPAPAPAPTSVPAPAPAPEPAPPPPAAA